MAWLLPSFFLKREIGVIVRNRNFRRQTEVAYRNLNVGADNQTDDVRAKGETAWTSLIYPVLAK
jgi:hypothetical protein